MDIYNYSAVTGEYLYKSKALESPLEPEVFLLPANCTPIAPPTFEAGKVAVFSSNQWSVFPDHRDETYWLSDTTSHQVTAIGELPTGAITTPPPALAPNQQISYADGAWVTTPDFIGVTYWLPDGSEHSVTELGPLPELAILIPPPPAKAGFALEYVNGSWNMIPDSYDTKRAASYPNIGDQLDMIWHTINDELPLDKTSSFYLAIAEVKDTYPKP